MISMLFLHALALGTIVSASSANVPSVETSRTVAATQRHIVATRIAERFYRTKSIERIVANITADAYRHWRLDSVRRWMTSSKITIVSCNYTCLTKMSIIFGHLWTIPEDAAWAMIRVENDRLSGKVRQRLIRLTADKFEVLYQGKKLRVFEQYLIKNQQPSFSFVSDSHCEPPSLGTAISLTCFMVGDDEAYAAFEKETSDFPQTLQTLMGQYAELPPIGELTPQQQAELRALISSN